MQRKSPHPGRQHSSQGSQRASTCLDEFHERSWKSPSGRCESESEGQMLKKEAVCHSDNFLFRADSETRTLARQCLAVHVNPQSGVRLTAPRGRCESESGGRVQKKEAICRSDNFLFSAGSLTIIEVYPTISRSSQTSFIGMNRCSTVSLLLRKVYDWIEIN